MFAKVRCNAILFLVFVVISRAGATTEIYVKSSAGDHNGDGSFDYPYKTIQKAANVAATIEGPVIVYVKAGPPYDYFNDHMTTQNYHDSDGVLVPSNNVSFIGYIDNPGENLAAKVPASYAQYQSSGGYINLPRIVGTSRSIGTGIRISGSNNGVVKNFHIKNFCYGVSFASSTSCTIENVAATHLGSTSDESLVGTGIVIDNQVQGPNGGLQSGWGYNRVTNCFVLNGSYGGIVLAHSNENVVTQCRVYCDDNTGLHGPTDYYILIDNGGGNFVTGCKAERKLDPNTGVPPAHTGHGITVQAMASQGQFAFGNQIFQCYSESIDEPFLLRGSGSSNNFFSECTSTLILADNAQGRISLDSGPHDNRFSRMRLNCKAAVGFLRYHDSVPPPLKDTLALNVAANNTFENCIFECQDAAIELSFWNDLGTGTGNVHVVNNQWLNCTFVFTGGASNSGAFFRSNRLSFANQLNNCIIKGFKTFAAPYGTQTGFYVPNQSHFAFHYCCSWNPLANNFPSPSIGQGNINPAADPQMNGYLYNLVYGSPCINRGTTVAYGVDCDGTPRPQQGAFDIGAQEFPPN
jgi:hypothetical protein